MGQVLELRTFSEDQPSGQYWFSEKGRKMVKIGTMSTADVRLASADVCRFHAAIEMTSEKIVLQDLVTRTGTFLNGEPVQRATLKDGDVITIGKTYLGVHLGPETVHQRVVFPVRQQDWLRHPPAERQPFVLKPVEVPAMPVFRGSPAHVFSAETLLSPPPVVRKTGRDTLWMVQQIHRETRNMRMRLAAVAALIVAGVFALATLSSHSAGAHQRPAHTLDLGK